ncbi:MAG TPA: TonB family protein [Candidatus Sulfotelmatobacter sp.]|nr:TonB family protein [Candidatus Sulfotelmatobacter sp.]
MTVRIILLLYVLAAFGPSGVAQTDAWLQVRTPHFLIASNSTEKEASRAARQFEGMRSVFQRVFPDAQLDTAAPMLVLAVQDKAALRELEPEAYLGNGRLNLVGLFVSAPEKNYVLILLNATGAQPYAPIYHEYAHFVFSRTHQWMPVWFSEGIAEFYQNTEILDDKVRLGKGDPNIQYVLEHNALLPLSTLLAVDQHSPYYHEDDKGSIFYSESWALAHHLKDQDDLEGTHRLTDYIDLLQTNVEPLAAATQAFGDLAQLQQDLKKYVVTGQYAVSDLPGSTDVDDSSFVVQPLTSAQSGTIRAEFLAHDDREQDARALLQGVLHDDPANVAAREVMGYVAFRQQNFAEAQKWCLEAIKLDPSSLMGHFIFAAASIRKGAPDKATQASIEESLHTVMKLNPSFVQAYDALATFYAMRGTKLAEANQLIQKAIQLAPGVPEIRADEAQVLSSMHKNKEAIEVLELALKMTHTPEQTAEVENVLQSLRQLEAEQAKARGRSAIFVRQGAASSGSAGQGASSSETPPRAIYSPQAEYTEEARVARLEGVCVVSLVVGIDGKPSNIVVTKKLGMGLDEKAVQAMSKWKFEPAHRNGKPVATRLTLNLQFKIFGGNTEKFVELSERARDGDAASEFELAKAFFEGRDIPKDEAQGMALLERAARSGLP